MSNFNITSNNYGNYSIEECIENMLKRINYLEKENEQLKANFVGETISDEVIQLLNKKLKNDIMLLCNKIDNICGENIKLTQDQKSFNDKTRNDIVCIITAYDKLQMTIQNMESELIYTKKLTQVAFDKAMKLAKIQQNNLNEGVSIDSDGVSNNATDNATNNASNNPTDNN